MRFRLKGSLLLKPELYRQIESWVAAQHDMGFDVDRGQTHMNGQRIYHEIWVSNPETAVQFLLKFGNCVNVI